jgi:hypothetical protein
MAIIRADLGASGCDRTYTPPYLPRSIMLPWSEQVQAVRVTPNFVSVPT